MAALELPELAGSAGDPRTWPAWTPDVRAGGAGGPGRQVIRVSSPQWGSTPPPAARAAAARETGEPVAEETAEQGRARFERDALLFLD